MKKNPFLVGLLALTAATSAARGAGEGQEVVIVYNSRLSESKRIAEHYAERRQVPANQIFGFDLPTSEEISRQDYRDSLQKPLVKALEEKKLWHIGSQIIAPTNDKPGRVDWKVVESKIRYAVLCYGVPTRILKDPNLVEDGFEKVRPELRRNEAAVDSELACLPSIQQKLALGGPLKNPFFSVTNRALLHPTNGVLMVARLDGPTADIARGLVDKAIQAETDGLWGRAYFDVRNITEEGYKAGDEWIRGAAEICRHLGFETVTDTNSGTFPLAFPMSHIALYAGWYDQNVSGPFARPIVEFMPGAVAYHLHSFSAGTVRSTNQCWVGPLLAKGAAATMGCVDEPYLMGTPDIGVFFGRFVFFGFSFGEAAYASQNALSWQTTIIGDPLYRPFAKSPQDRHAELERHHSKLAEWSYLQWVNFNVANGKPMADWIAFLEQLPETKKSAVLSEKLGDMYAAQGKPSSAVHGYQEALKLNPSPQQRVRLRLTLGEKLVALNREADAYADYRDLLREARDYPDSGIIYKKLSPLAQKLGKLADVESLQKELDRHLPTPPKTPATPPRRAF